jgi:hypothetical protein
MAALVPESVGIELSSAATWNRTLARDLGGSRRPEAGWDATAFEFDNSMDDALSADEQNAVDTNDD